MLFRNVKGEPERVLGREYIVLPGSDLDGDFYTDGEANARNLLCNDAIVVTIMVKDLP